MATTTTFGQLAVGDTALFFGSPYTVESIARRGANGGTVDIVWKNTNAGQPYIYSAGCAVDIKSAPITKSSSGYKLTDTDGTELIVSPEGDGLVINATSADGDSKVDFLVTPDQLDAILSLVSEEALTEALGHKPGQEV